MNPRRSVSNAFSLIEIAVALGVGAVSLLAIFGLLATGLQINQTAAEQTISTDLLMAVANDLRATPSSSMNSMQFGIAIPPNPVGSSLTNTIYFDSNGVGSTSLTSDTRYRLTITFLPTGPGRIATRAILRVTWPAPADPLKTNTQSAELFVALDRN